MLYSLSIAEWIMCNNVFMRCVLRPSYHVYMCNIGEHIHMLCILQTLCSQFSESCDNQFRKSRVGTTNHTQHKYTHKVWIELEKSPKAFPPYRQTIVISSSSIASLSSTSSHSQYYRRRLSQTHPSRAYFQLHMLVRVGYISFCI